MKGLRHSWKKENLYLKDYKPSAFKKCLQYASFLEMEIKKIGIIGAGAMGTGIGQVAASNGCSVIFYDAYTPSLAKSKQSLYEVMDKLVAKNKLNRSKADELLTLCTWTHEMKDIVDAELIIEAIVEDFQVKKNIFTDLSEKIDSTTIVASNTSSLSITSLATTMQHPERFAGLHFFNPAPVMKLVEVIPALQTHPDTVSTLMQLMGRWSKVPVTAHNTPGFIVNRVARPFYGEALRIYDEGLAGCSDIDKAMKVIGGFNMGPFELMDFIGHDVNFRVTESVYNSMFQDPRYKPSLTQKSLLDAGWLGRKSKKGFYNYPEGTETMRPIDTSMSDEDIFNRIFSMMVNEAADAVYMGICTEEDAEKAMQLGTNYPKGLLEWGREYGYERIVQEMERLRGVYQEDRYRLSPYFKRL